MVAPAVHNDHTATWTGAIIANHGWVLNAGGAWTGDVLSNNAQLWNDSWAGELALLLTNPDCPRDPEAALTVDRTVDWWADGH